MSSTAPLRLNIKPQSSRLLRTYLILIHSASIVTIGLSEIPLQLSWLMVCIVSLSLFIQWRRLVIITGSSAIASAVWLTNTDWILITGEGNKLRVHQWQASLVQPFLVILEFKVNGRQRLIRLHLFKDSISSDLHRKLRIRIKAENGPQDGKEKKYFERNP